MSNDITSFDLQKCERSRRVIKSETGKLSRMSDRISREIENLPQWWVGDSLDVFMHKIKNLEALMRETVSKANEMSENLTKTVEYKKAEEENLRNEIASLNTI